MISGDTNGQRKGNFFAKIKRTGVVAYSEVEGLI